MFATRLKELRIEQGYSVKDISKKLNVSNVTFYRYESGKRNPNCYTIYHLSEFFDVSIDYLFGKTDNKMPIENSGVIDVKDKIDNIIFELESGNPLLFDGELLNEDANIALVIALKIGINLACSHQKKVK